MAPDSESSKALPQSTSSFELFLETLKSYRGIAEAVVATVGAMVAALAGLRKSAADQPPWILIVALAVVGIAALLFVRDLRRRSRIRVRPISTSRFVGPQPMTREDRDKRGFYGRDHEVEKIVSKLRDPRIRHLVLIGESGCGKTSLLLAGVIPMLEEGADTYPIYLRLSDQPVRALRQALRQVGTKEPAPLISTSSSITPARVSLVEELSQARERAQKPLVVFIDQFEEFHVNPVAQADYQAVQELVWAVTGKDASIDAKLVFSLRYDFLHLMDVFYDERYVDKNFANGEVRVRIEPFEEKVATEVIYKSLQSDEGTLEWNEMLVRRVLQDLTVEKIIYGQPRKIVLPAELQIVFQMVQTHRILTTDAYPGKRRLLLEYVSDAIDTVPGTEPSLARQLMLNFIDANGLTKAKPQTLDQLAAQLQIKNTTRLLHILEYLDRNRRIVRSFSVRQPDGKQSVVYELAHDYLAGVIRIVAGAEMGGTRRSQAILHSGRMQSEHNPAFRLSVADCWHLRRYPPPEITAEDRQIIRQSWISFGWRYCVPIALVLADILFVRFATLHFVQGGRGVELKRGAPFLPPLLSSASVSVATEVDLSDELYNNEPGKRLAAIVKSSPWLPSSLAFVSWHWDWDALMKREMVQAALAHLQSRESQYTVAESTDQAAVELLTALGTDRDRSTASDSLQKRLNEGFNQYAALCIGLKKDSRECDQAKSTLTSVATNLQRLRLQLDAQLVKSLQEQVRSNSIDSWAFQQSFEILDKLHAIDSKTASSLIQRLSGGATEQIDEIVLKLLWIDHQPKETVRDLLGTAVSDQLIQKLRTRLERPLEKEESSRILRALTALGSRTEALAEHWKELEDPDLRVQRDGLLGLLGLDVADDKLVDYIVKGIEAGTSKLWSIKNWDNMIFISMTVSRQKIVLPEISKAWDIMDALRWRSFGRTSASISYFADPRLKGAVQKFIDAYWERARQPSHGIGELADLATRVGLSMQQILEHAPKASTIEPEEFRTMIGAVFEARINELQPASTEIDRTANEQISEWVRLFIERGDDCEWEAIALHYGIERDDPEQTLLEYKGSCIGLPKEFARRILLRRTKGFGKPGTVAKENLVEAGYRMLELLQSPKADRSLNYRKSILVALNFIFTEMLKQSDGLEQVKKLRTRIMVQITQPEVPLHQLMALDRVLRELDNLIYQAGQSFALLVKQL